MTELLTAAQMRATERAAIESGAVSGLTLMERAGRGVVEAVLAEWPERPGAAQRAVVLCGPGNNGGDGFVVARLLAERGWQVTVFLYGRPEELPPDAQANHRRWSARGAVQQVDFPRIGDAQARAILTHLRHAGDGALLVDGLFGTGLTRPLTGLRPLLEGLAGDAAAPRVVAIDMPSGLCGDSGRPIAGKDDLAEEIAALRADLTVTFHRPRPGHFLAQGPGLCGRLRTVDIGLAASGCRNAITLIGRPALPDKAVGAHKYGHGHALVLSGGAGRTGAARLAARAALRVGAGLVTLGVPPAAQQEVACQITAAMLTRVADAAALAGLLADPRLNAVCLGPGLGISRARELVPVALGAGAAGRSAVLDADALTAYADDPGTLFAMTHEACVLTPHGGEFARLFPDIGARLHGQASRGPAYSRVDAAREAAVRAGAVVLIKGADTVIAAPDGRCGVHCAARDRAAPWLATAGAGDVLAGLVAGLLARGLPAMRAAETAAWLHVEAARRFGPGLIAEDLPESLPQVLRALAAGTP